MTLPTYPQLNRRRASFKWLAVLLVPLGCFSPQLAYAHASDRGFVLLLPTDLVLIGGSAAVALSFLILALVPKRSFLRLADWRFAVMSSGLTGAPWRRVGDGLSLLSFLLFLSLLYAGLQGTRDPLTNPLPVAIWTLWWVGITLAHAFFGNIWTWLNPWRGPYRLLCRIAGGQAPPLKLPKALGYSPAILSFAAFAWFELIHIAPDDPEVLAQAAASYWAATMLAIMLFGEEAWLKRGECFSLFFGLLAKLAPFTREPVRGTISLCLPGVNLCRQDPLPISAVLFVLLVLSYGSFDGLNKTFWWLALNGINPLEFPGRSAVVLVNSLGLLAMWLTLSALFFLGIWIGWKLSRGQGSWAEDLGRLIYSIIPIPLGFHFAHHLTGVLINGQYAVLAANDPLGTGADLLGQAGLRVSASFMMVPDSVALIWGAQTAAIVLAHILAVCMAHLLALRIKASDGQATRSQIPLAILMVFYTLFGLWLLSTPTGA